MTTPPSAGNKSVYAWLAQHRWWLPGLRTALIAILLAVSTAIVYATGGTAYAYAYLMLIPVLLAAAWYQLAGGLAVAAIAGLLVGPYMPLEVQQEIPQQTFNWVLRLGFYLALGGLAGGLFRQLTRATALREQTIRIDPSSGLLNSVALVDDLKLLLSLPAQVRNRLAIILASVTDIGEILSGVGAGGSDLLLSALNKGLQNQLPEGARIYRFGASEFVVLTSHDSAADLQKLINTVVQSATESVVIRGIPVRAELALGVSLAEPDEHIEAMELIRRARIALFATLQKHKSFSFYAPAQEQATEKTIRLIAQVSNALDEGQFELHYQPKICLADGSIAGSEGLIRWRHPNGELIPPGDFMPKVERTALITPVTRFVVLQALKFIHQHPGIPVSVNFTVRNLFDEVLLQWLRWQITEHGIPPQMLEIEITEGALIQDPKAAMRIIAELRQWGLGVTLDDFGTGYSSFGYLRELPISGLKIDRAFVRDLESDAAARKLTACIVDMAHVLNLSVTAEGVETTGQRDILRDMGCDQAQGFLYSKAVALEDYKYWARRHRLKSRSPAQ
jgi:EAL domain-containing protein (putative c-di-GMP-specific phosphodiesterase class I)/GGDEF domain-containing protein